MDVLFIDRPALLFGLFQHRDKGRGPFLAALGDQGPVSVLEGRFRAGLGSQPVQFLRNAHDLGNGADRRSFSSGGVAAAVPALHVLFAAFPDHPPGDVLGLPALFPAAAFLQSRGQSPAVGGVFSVDRPLFLGKVRLPYLIFRRHQGFADLVVHSAFIGQVCVSAPHFLGAFSCILAEGAGAGLHEKRLRIGGHPDGLLPHRRSQPPEGLVPGLIFPSFPGFFHSASFPSALRPGHRRQCHSPPAAYYPAGWPFSGPSGPSPGPAPDSVRRWR